MGRGTCARSWFAVLWLAAVLAFAAPASAQPSLETGIKATYLVRFGSFVEWPAHAFPEPNAPLTICVAGDDAMAQNVARAVGENRPGRGVSVRRFDTIRRGSGCNVLFAGGGPGQSVVSSLRAVENEPVLTVTDARNGPARGMIHFVVVDNRVRFHIDEREASLRGLRINARLLNIGLTVQGRRAGGAP